MEITVISAQGLKNTSSSLFSRRIKPFVTLSLPPPPCQSNGYKPCHVYKTRVDGRGGMNPTWGDTFHIPIDYATFFCQQRPFVIYLQLYNNVLTGGLAQLGWCQIPATDIVDELSPPGLVRHLSYRLRARDGSRGHGVVNNVAVRLDCLVLPQVFHQRPPNFDVICSPEMGLGKTVVGIPVTKMLPEPSVKFGCNNNTNNH